MSIDADKLKCPQWLCFHWCEKQDYVALGYYQNLDETFNNLKEGEESACSCTLGTCIRTTKEHGDKDMFEPCEPKLRKILKNSVTGFRDKNYSKLLLHNQEKKFIKDFHSIINKINGKILYIDADFIGKNFYIATIIVEGIITYSLLNINYPLIAFASKVEPFAITFINDQILAEEFRNLNYIVLSINQLSCPIKKEYLKELNKMEMKQIEYWQPNTLGEIVFNYWD